MHNCVQVSRLAERTKGKLTLGTNVPSSMADLTAHDSFKLKLQVSQTVTISAECWQ